MFFQKLKHYDVFLFVSIGLVVTLFLLSSIQERKNLQLNSLVQVNETQLKSALDAEQKRAERFYDDHAQKIALLLAKAQNADEEDLVAIRQAILNQYQGFYDNARNQGLSVLHIFDAEGNSFIRFHRPGWFGDNVAEIRPSVDKVIQKQLYSQGIEIGCLKVAYRFIFPLFYDGLLVGGLEFSVDYLALARQMGLLYGTQHQQFILTQRIKSSIDERYYDELFEGSGIEGYSISKKHKPLQKSVLENLQKLQSSVNLEEQLNEQKRVAFFIELDGQPFQYSFIPLFDTDNEFIGFSLAVNKLEVSILDQLNRVQLIELSVFWVLWIGLFYFWRRKVKSEDFSLAILDTQSSFLALTRHNKMIYANKSLLNFLGFRSYESYIEKYDCICDLFLPGEDYLQKYMGELTWSEYVISHPDKEHKVKLKGGQDKQEHILLVQVKPFVIDGPLLVTLSDITQMEVSRNKLEEEVRHDPLTGAFNRRAFDVFTTDILNSNHPKFSLVLLDIDFFKTVNDTYGHDVGDIVLKNLTDLILAHIRDSDYLIRWGGEEFIIILDNTDIDNAEMIANKLRLEVSQYFFPTIENLTCSFGVSQYRLNENVDELISRCDHALYFAKEHGRNRVVTR